MTLSPRPEPPSLKWVARFIESMNRALDGDIYSWELAQRSDPLQWVFIITLKQPWTPLQIRPLRDQLKAWAVVNEAEYQRSRWAKREFRALLFTRGLGPEMNISPYEDDNAVHRRRRGRPWRDRGTNRGRSSDRRGRSPQGEDS